VRTRSFAGRSARGRAFPAGSGRYHLYVSLACPWAHRTLIVRSLKELEAHIGVSVVSPIMREQGWTFATEEGSSGDKLGSGVSCTRSTPLRTADYSGRVTVPVLWDTAHGTIVNNESADIIRMLEHGLR
jgi:putative glutathione S-transferase